IEEICFHVVYLHLEDCPDDHRIPVINRMSPVNHNPNPGIKRLDWIWGMFQVRVGGLQLYCGLIIIP
ncbi:MAG: hypothetical protein PHQ40_04845, partial [Anaerolineaceae bacterium]|nr:hypothetical protein [Anaerolineaceae bacterium]